MVNTQFKVPIKSVEGKKKTIEKLTKNINKQLIEFKTLLDSLKILRSLNFPSNQRNTSKNFGEIHFIYRW